MALARRTGRAVLLVAALGVLGCGSDSSAGATATKTLGPEGGTLTGSGVVLTVPESALDSDVEISVQRLELSEVSGFELFSAVYEFSPEGLEFEQPVEVSIEFDGPASRAGFYWTRKGSKNRFEEIEAVFERGVATAEVSHFSRGFVGALLDGQDGGTNVMVMDASIVSGSDASTVLSPDGGVVQTPDAGPPPIQCTADAIPSIINGIPPEGVTRPSIAKTDSGFAMTWSESDPNTQAGLMRSALLDGQHQVIGSVVPLSAPVLSLQTAVASSGIGYAALWDDVDVDKNTNMFFRTFDANGQPVITAQPLAMGFGAKPFGNMVWTGSHYAFAWTDASSNGNVYLARIGTDGQRLGNDWLLAQGGIVFNPHLNWNGTQYAVVWPATSDMNGHLDLEFRVVDVNGDPAGGGQVTNQLFIRRTPGIAASDSGYGLVWHDPDTGETNFLQLDSNGTTVGQPLAIATMGHASSQPRIAWDGAHFGVTYMDRTNVTQFLLVDTAGQVVVESVPLQSLAPAEGIANVIWTGSDFVLTWSAGAVLVNHVVCQ